MWRITAFSSYFLTETLRKRQLQYSTAISGKVEQEPRWKVKASMSFHSKFAKSFLFTLGMH